MTLASTLYYYLHSTCLYYYSDPFWWRAASSGQPAHSSGLESTQLARPYSTELLYYFYYTALVVFYRLHRLTAGLVLREPLTVTP